MAAICIVINVAKFRSLCRRFGVVQRAKSSAERLWPRTSAIRRANGTAKKSTILSSDFMSVRVRPYMDFCHNEKKNKLLRRVMRITCLKSQRNEFILLAVAHTSSIIFLLSAAPTVRCADKQAGRPTNNANKKICLIANFIIT